MELILLAAAVIAGATGTWSPCGFSAVETISPSGHTGGRLLSVIASSTFLAGALAGGLITFGALALAGSALGGGSAVGVAIAAGIAVAAAAGEWANLRVVPQIRRQVPEQWRRWMPLPLVGAGYGLLLGLGFTTFVLTFGVWALAGITLAAGDVDLGLAVGIAFGLGRAIPVVLLAPVADTDAGCRVLDAMAERPATYRAFRLANAGALTAAALAIVTTGALAKKAVDGPAYDPSSAGAGALAYERPGGGSFLAGPAGPRKLPGTDPALGGPWVAVKRAGRIELLNRRSLTRVGGFEAPQADAIAIDRRFVVWRTRKKGRDQIYVRPVRSTPDQGGTPPAAGPEGKDAAGVGFGEVKRLASTGRKAQLGRPSVDGTRAVWALSTLRKSSIVLANLKRGRTKRIRGSTGAALENASLAGKHIAYVRVSARKQLLKLARIGGGSGRTITRVKRGLLWSTELTGKRIYATVRNSKGLTIRSWSR